MSTALLKVPIAQIEVPHNVRRRFDAEQLAELAKSIESVGLQHPLLCGTDGKVYPVIDGERRLRACRDLLHWTEIPVLVVQDRIDAANALTRQLVCNLQRADLDPLERAEGIRDLMERASLNGEQVAATLGLSPAMVSRSLSLLKLPEPVRRQVESGELPADTACILARVSDPAEQTRLLQEVTGKRLSRDALARKLKRVCKAGQHGASGPARVTAALGSGRAVTLVGKGLTLDSVIEWLEQLLAGARKSKSQGLSLETFIRTLRNKAAKA